MSAKARRSASSSTRRRKRMAPIDILTAPTDLSAACAEARVAIAALAPLLASSSVRPDDLRAVARRVHLAGALVASLAAAECQRSGRGAWNPPD